MRSRSGETVDPYVGALPDRPQDCHPLCTSEHLAFRPTRTCDEYPARSDDEPDRTEGKTYIQYRQIGRQGQRGTDETHGRSVTDCEYADGSPTRSKPPEEPHKTRRDLKLPAHRSSFPHGTVRDNGSDDSIAKPQAGSGRQYTP